MSVTRNVIVDLLPACAAGEAHADSLKLVEEWATRDAGPSSGAQRAGLDLLRTPVHALHERGRALFSTEPRLRGK